MSVWMPPEWLGDDKPAVSGDAVAHVPGPRTAEPPARPPRDPSAAPWPWFAAKADEGSGHPSHEPAASPPPPGVRPVAPGRHDADRRAGPTGAGAGAAGGASAPDSGASRGDGAGQPVRGPELTAGSPPPLPRRVPQSTPPPFGVSVSPGGASLFQPPKRKPRADRLHESDPSMRSAAPRWAPHPPAPAPAEPPAVPPVASSAQDRSGPDRLAAWSRRQPASSPPAEEPHAWGLSATPADSRSGRPAAPWASPPAPAGQPPAQPSGTRPAAPQPSGAQVSGVQPSGAQSAAIRPPVSQPPGTEAADLRTPGSPASGLPAPGLPASGRPAAGLPASGFRASGPPAPGLPAPGFRASGSPGPGIQGPRPEAAGPQAPSTSGTDRSGSSAWSVGRPAGRPLPPPAGARSPDGSTDAPETDGAERARALPPVADPSRAPGFRPGDVPGDPAPTGPGVDEPTTFMSQWGPPPLTSPRPDEDHGESAWGRPPQATPFRSGGGSSPSEPPPPPARATPFRSGGGSGASVPLPPPPAPTAPGAGAVALPPDEDAARLWVRDRMAGRRDTSPPVPAVDAPLGRTEAEDEPADDAVTRRAGDRPGPARTPAAGADGDRRTDDAVTRRAGDRSDATADAWVEDRRPGDRFRAGPAGPGDDARDGRRAGDDTAGRPGGRGRFVDEPTEVIGPFDVGAWTVTGRDGTPALERPRGHPRPAPEDRDAREHRDGDEPRQRDGGAGGNPPPTGGGGGDGEPGKRKRTLGDRIRTFLRGLGQTFLTVGIVLLLLAAYEVWFTDLVNDRTQSRLTSALEQQWQTGDDPTVGTTAAEPGTTVRSIPLGDGFALLYVPDFGTDYVYTVVEGTGVKELSEGPGHYVDTPLPGQVGNVAIAGHRVGKGSPFLNLDKLQAGSAIVIRTRSYWYTYRVLGDTGTGDADAVSSIGIRGREIVDPSDTGVIAPVPHQPGATPTRRLLTLTTCHPKFSARQRMVIHAIQDGSPYPVGNGTPPSMTGT